jgi:hypothetical protein
LRSKYASHPKYLQYFKGKPYLAGHAIKRERKMIFYVTYGNDSTLGQCYSEIESDSFMHAREEAFRVTKGKFAFFYDAHDFANQITKFGLTKVPLQPAEHVVW